MTEPKRHGAVPRRRGAVSRFNDATMEYVIAIARGVTIGGFLAVPVQLIGLAWTGDLRWLWTLLVVLPTALGAGWIGFYVNANEEWRR